jgi:hypothetical protein
MTQYTRKHFIEAARLVREGRAHAFMRFYPYADETYDAIEDAYVKQFAASNPRFDEKRFRNACNPREM